MSKRPRKLTITQQIMRDAAEKLKVHEHDLTRKQYTNNVKRYVKFCREKYNVKTFEDCKSYIQEYSNYLQKENYTASTIHTYLAAVCCVFKVDMASIQKPVRHTADYTKGRENKLRDVSSDINNPKFSYVVDFQRKVGIRRDELMRLTGHDFVYDESGYPCVRVLKGKGGKTQYQRILDEDVAFVKAYFDRVGEKERVFDRKYFQNDLNFHILRSQCAKRYYNVQLEKMKNDPKYCGQLEKEILKRWNAMNIKKNGKPKVFDWRECKGVYTLRAKNRKLAQEKGLSVNYDKTALLATSIFVLSHWRNDVTVASYLLV